MELNPAVERIETEGGFLIGRRGEGNIDWSNIQMRREGSFSVQFSILSLRGTALYSQKGGLCLAAVTFWWISCETLESFPW